MQETRSEETAVQEAQGAFLKALTNMPAYDGSQHFEKAIATALVEGLALFSNESAKGMLRIALESVTEFDRKVRYEAEIQEHVAAGGKYVNIYCLDHNNYGGAAEGGWYYTSGTPLEGAVLGLEATTKVHPKDDPERAAETISGMINLAHVKKNYGLVDVELEVKIEDRPAEYWPAVKPHYQ
tara:strand:+ start:312 stop:857 length:546 start_codon:yes stop_codon:yes gene_type:complete